MSKSIVLLVLMTSLFLLGSSCTDPPGPEPSALPEGVAFAGPLEIDIRPDTLGPGDLASLSFPDSNQRGTYFAMRVWEGDEWSEVKFITTAQLSGQPSEYFRSDESFDVSTMGREGAGADVIRIPDEVEPGVWEICTAFVDPTVCGSFTGTG